MAALDVVVVPSLHDAQTIVIPEAFAAAKPVIASRVGGIPELVTHEENGLLVEPADNDALASAMIRLLANPVLRNDLASAGFRLARRELSFEEKSGARAGLLRQSTPSKLGERAAFPSGILRGGANSASMTSLTRDSPFSEAVRFAIVVSEMFCRAVSVK